MKWADTQEYYNIDTVLVVPMDGLFYYFSLDSERYYNLIMSSEKNLAEGE